MHLTPHIAGRGLVTALALAASLACSSLATAFAHPVPQAPACPILPADNPWNQRVDGLPIAAGSAAIVRATGIARLHADFSSVAGGNYGIPFNVVDASTPRSSVSFDYADESDPGPYPIPASPAIEGGSDRHMLLLERDSCTLYELFAAQRGGSAWQAGSGAIWNLRSDALRPAGWTSADAAGLPIFPGLARYDDVAAGGIDHALRITLPQTQRAYLWPARHYASSNTAAVQAPMGLRLRIRSSFDIAHFPPQAQAVLLAAQRYGLIVADNGSAGYVTGAPSPGWNDDDLHTLQQVPASAFEVVDTSALPGAPARASAWNARIRVARGRVTATLFHSRSGPLTLTARRGRRVVAHVRVRAGQGYLQLRMRAVRGATYALLLR